MTSPRYVVQVMIDEPHGTKDNYGYTNAAWVAVRATRRIIDFFFSSRRRHTRYIGAGVQTCALPISRMATAIRLSGAEPLRFHWNRPRQSRRSEERREGKSVDLGGRRIIKKKKK